MPCLLDLKVSVNSANGIVTATHNTRNISLTFIPTPVDGGVPWCCDPGKLPKNQVPQACRPAAKTAP